MTPEEIRTLQAARERLCRQRNDIARDIATDELASVEPAGDLTVVLTAIEAIDRALSDAGSPYMRAEVREGASLASLHDFAAREES
jgi:hypothetical protein